MAEKENNRDNMRRLKTISSKVPENVKINIDDVIRRFQDSMNINEFTFPNSLTSHERAYIHAQAGQLGLKSQSDGSGDNRQVTLKKSLGNDRKVLSLLQLHPLSIVAIQNLEPSSSGYDLPPVELPSSNITGNKKSKGMTKERITERSSFTNRLFTSPGPKIPKRRVNNQFDAGRMRLPIFKFQKHILDTIRMHNVIFIKGDTGCGKTTQVPQFILDDATARNEKVRIVCTVPRRIAAITISDRVATERGECVGFTVGYQIRLESCISPCDTILTYCTSGILLRSLTSFDYSILKNTTHIIIDEIHERDRQTEFLLACLRDVGSQFPNLKLILMGADMDTQLMTTYFGGAAKCPLIEVHGRLYPVKVQYLEDILTVLQFDQEKRQRHTNNRKSNSVMDNLVNTLKHSTRDGAGQVGNCRQDNFTSLTRNERSIDSTKKGKMYNTVIQPQYEVDDKIQKIWANGDDSAMAEYLNLIKRGQASVDYQHRETEATMLMACAAQGRVNEVQMLLSMGADTNLSMRLPDGRLHTAKDWASDEKEIEILRVIEEHEYRQTLLEQRGCSRNMDLDVKDRLDRYQNLHGDDRVDLQLIVDIIYRVHVSKDTEEAILIFLPGYDEIVTLKHMIFNDDALGNLSDHLLVFLLHSNIQSGDQRAVFKIPKRGMRKIVLSTNIAETSLTIEDIVYVIDSGRVKEKTFDSMTGVTQLKAQWISKASVNQRTGRAGRCRPGMCFRLYSSTRYESMNEFPVAEIVRSSLQELCMYTRSFIRKELKIKDFFTRLPEPPAPIAVKKSVDALVAMGALDENEQLTKLGLSLLDFPIEPYLGKALLYAVALKCLDPVLTIITIISHREPFQLPLDPDERTKALQSKFEFSGGTLSDHMSSLRAFQDWEKSTLFTESVQKKFCRDRYLSSACFEMVCGIRSQLLGQLRAAGFVQNCGANDLKDLNTNSENWSLVKGILTGILYPNICYIDKQNKCLFNEYDTKIKFHNSSTLAMNRKDGLSSIPADWVIYDEMCQQDFAKSLRTCTLISDVPLAIFGGNFTLAPIACDEVYPFTMNDSDHSEAVAVKRFDLNDWISFRGMASVIDAILYLRKRLNELMMKRLQFPTVAYSSEEDAALQVITSILMSEDEVRGFQQIQGIGQWPKLVSGNVMSTPSAGFERSFAFSDRDEQDNPTPGPSRRLRNS